MEHIEVLKEGGLVEEQVLAVPVNEQAVETYCIDTCSECEKSCLDLEEVYVWGEPHGRFVTLLVHCSEECVAARMQRRTDEISKDIILVMLRF